MKYNVENIKKILVRTMMEELRDVEVENVTFELLPLVPRTLGSDAKRLAIAESHADAQIKILLED